MDQVAIVFCSASSIYFLSGKRARWVGFVLGLCGQPFWFYTSFVNRQWGVLLLSLWFTFCHARGFVNERRRA